jgi:hypothetical protein
MDDTLTLCAWTVLASVCQLEHAHQLPAEPSQVWVYAMSLDTPVVALGAQVGEGSIAALSTGGAVSKFGFPLQVRVPQHLSDSASCRSKAAQAALRRCCESLE